MAMLRPATPLAILLFAAFGLLLLATISTPIIKDIPLGEHGGFKFGVFGYCTSTRCSPFEIGYDAGKRSRLLSHPLAKFVTT